MAMTNKKKLLIALAVVVAVVGIAVAMRNPKPSLKLNEINSPVSGVDPKALAQGDTVADTLKVMTNQYKAVDEKMAKYNEQQKDMLAMRGQIATQVSSDLKGALNDVQAEQKKNNATIERWAQKLDAIERKVGSLSKTPPNDVANAGLATGTPSDVPTGLGFDDYVRGAESPPLVNGGTGAPGKTTDRPMRRGRVELVPVAYSSVSALSTSAALNGAAVAAANPLADTSGAPTLGAGPAPATDQASSPPRSDTGGKRDGKRYTIPALATLTNSVAMTAIIGRVAVGGKIDDAVPFKVITGADNLATNGLRLPEVKGAIWEGLARGDWVLQCVRGDVNKVTFIFKDGTITTIKKDKLGWISDEYGNCIAGIQVTNAGTVLTKRSMMTGLEVGLKALASGKRQVMLDRNGNAVSQVNDALGMAEFEFLGGVAGDVKSWYDTVMKNTYDAVVVLPAAMTAIHVEDEVIIDYDPKGRKLNHGNDAMATNTSGVD